MRQLGAALLVLVLAGCARSRRRKILCRSSSTSSTGASRASSACSNQSLLDMAQKLDAAQADVRTLRGRVEELENSNEALQQAAARSVCGSRQAPGVGSARRAARVGCVAAVRRWSGGGAALGWRSSRASRLHAGVRCAEERRTIRRRIAGFQQFLSATRRARWRTTRSTGSARRTT